MPDSLTEADLDVRLAELAATVALRRHLRNVRVVVGSGGVLRHAAPARAEDAVRAAVADHSGGWKLPTDAWVVVDRSYVLAAAGLLSFEHRGAATALLRNDLLRNDLLSTPERLVDN